MALNIAAQKHVIRILDDIEREREQREQTDDLGPITYMKPGVYRQLYTDDPELGLTATTFKF